MPKKDKRIKGCPNPECIEYKEKKKYKADDQFCKKCGTQLIYVCSRCHAEIEDIEGHSLCKKCEAEILNNGGKVKLAVKDLGRRAKNSVGKGTKGAANTAKRGAIKVKEKAPVALDKVKAAAKDKNVQKAAAILADAAADGVKNKKVKKVAKKLINIVK